MTDKTFEAAKMTRRAAVGRFDHADPARRDVVEDQRLVRRPRGPGTRRVGVGRQPGVDPLVDQTAERALAEADVALGLGYHAGLLSLAAWRGASEEAIVEHCARVAARIPVVGFYLQPAVGGARLSARFWRRFAELDNVVAVKMAPFNRYATLDVIRGVVEARAEERIALYTGNDDHIVLDLVTPFVVVRDDEPVTVRVRGGLLGHWSVWVKSAVELVASSL